MKKEKEFMDNFKIKYKKLLEMKQLKPDYEVLLGEIGDINERITELFKLADSEHKEVDKYYKKSQKVHEKILKLNDDIKVLNEEATWRCEVKYYQSARSAGKYSRKRKKLWLILIWQ